MISKVIALLIACAMTLGIAYGRSGRQNAKSRDLIAPERRDVVTTQFAPQPPPDPSLLSAVGTSTTITGFWDFQINGGACEMIRVNPANGNIHVIMMISDDSVDQSGSRRTAYAMSTNNGTTWNNFNNVRVPNRRSGYPFLDLGRGGIAGGAVIGNHSVISGAILQSTAFIDFPEGSGAFVEIAPPALIEPTGADEPVWPAIACALDGSLTMAPGRLTAATTHITRTPDYVSWSAWFQFPGSDQGSARNVVIANGTGRVAVVQNAAGLNMIESTNNGANWPSTPQVLFPPSYPVGSDSFTVANGSDAVYSGNSVLAAVEATGIGTSTDRASIYFWSAATGIRLAVAHDTSRFISALNTSQTFQSTLGYPVIGMSGNTIVIVFAAFQREISAAGYNYCDLWWTASTNGGINWATPVNITSTPAVDERFPSISKYNPPGFATIVWQEKLDPGSSVRGERPITRASQKFLRFAVPTTGVEGETGIAQRFKLEQNYPNPFNPSTKISYTIPVRSDVKLSVYNVLGQEMATLVNEVREAGSYEVEFSSTRLPSGMYFYTLRADRFSDTKKLIVVK